MAASSMEVPTGLYAASLVIHQSKKLWRALARVETAVLGEELEKIAVESPIYIAGVARSGSTILLEMLSQHPALTSHHYSDFPNVYTPYWRNWLKQRASTFEASPRERAHNDRIQITKDSPEAIEEALWMDFFPNNHSPENNQVLDQQCRNPAFESFYRDHIRKLLLVRSGARYLAKGNYNLTRLPYIQSIFPDARFIIPLRHPVRHIASMMKQDALFKQGLEGNPRGRRYLQWAGHYEFGPDKQPVNIGDDALCDEINSCWQREEHVRAWALHWNSLYSFALAQGESNATLNAACSWVRYEDLCADSSNIIDGLLTHCRLDKGEFAELKSHYSEALSEPEYYQVDYSPPELQLIWDICGETAQRLGYKQ